VVRIRSYRMPRWTSMYQRLRSDGILLPTSSGERGVPSPRSGWLRPIVKLQIPRLRFASVPWHAGAGGMTKGRAAQSRLFGENCERSKRSCEATREGRAPTGRQSQVSCASRSNKITEDPSPCLGGNGAGLRKPSTIGI
jgi:hypothetical protein